MLPPAVSPSQTLCLSCGMCCNGSLHNWTNLRAIETDQAAVLGLQVFILPEGSPAFLQPCAAFEAPACTVYAQRPQSCRNYRCKLLIALEQSEISLSDSLGLTQRARELIEALRAYMDEPDPGLPLERQVRYQWPNAKPPGADVVLTELTELLESHWGVRWSPLAKRTPPNRR